MYVLIISRGFPSEKYKMNGIFEFDQAKALAQAGCKVVYIAVDVRSIRRWRKWGYESFTKDGINVESINIPCGRIPNLILDKISILALEKIYKKVVRKYGIPEIIHTHFINIGYIVAHKFNKDKIPIVLTEHFSGINEKNINLELIKKGKYTYPRMDKVIAVSNPLANNIRLKFGIETVVIPNIIDTKSFNYISQYNNKSFNFISTGSLSPRKNMDLLIKCFYDAFSNNRDVQLYIFGEGSERKKLEKIIYDYKLEEQVFLMGLVSRTVIAEKMGESQCFVLASKLETFGVAYIEAMSMGLPVISSTCGGPEDFVNESNGLLVPVNNKTELTKALIKVYKNIEVYDKKTISENTRNKFSSPVIAKQIIEVYKDVLNRGAE